MTGSLGLHPDWVRHEIEQAFSKNKEASSIRLIPVRLDSTPIPNYLTDIRYIDLSSNYDKGIDELTELINREKPQRLPAVSDILSPDTFAEYMGREQKAYKGSGYVVTTVLGILTLIITAITAIPSFYGTFGQKAKVFYSVTSERITVPQEIDISRFRELLRTQNIPDATIRVDVVNMGTAGAKSIKAGIKVPGEVEYSKSEPPAEPEPVWVKISSETTKESFNSYIKYSFDELVPTRVVSVLIGYRTFEKDGKEVIDVVFDGLPAQRVRNVEEVAKWSLWHEFKKPLSVLAAGFGLTILFGIAVVIRASPRLREASLLLLKELNPTVSRIADMLIKATR